MTSAAHPIFRYDHVKAGNILLVRHFEIAPALDADIGDLEYIKQEVLHVVRLVRNAQGRTINLVIEPLEYAHRPGRSPAQPGPSYQIYGNEVFKRNTTRLNSTATLETLWDYAARSPGQSMWFLNNPWGSQIVRFVFDGKCPAGCDNGWLSFWEHSMPLMDEIAVPALSSFRPLCSVCFGKEIVLTQLYLRQSIENQTFFGQSFIWHTWKWFQGRVSNLRMILGYEGCICARCLLPYATDAIHPDDEEEERRFRVQFVRWRSLVEELDAADLWETPSADALDPNAGRKARSTSGDTIAALPRKTAGSVHLDDDSRCIICLESYEDDDELIELLCRHCNHAGCIETWLRESDTCPECRHVVGEEAKTSGAADDERPSENGGNGMMVEEILGRLGQLST